MLASCVAVLAMTVIYEGLKFARQRLRQAAVRCNCIRQFEDRSETPVDDELPYQSLKNGFTNSVYELKSCNILISVLCTLLVFIIVIYS